MSQLGSIVFTSIMFLSVPPCALIVIFLRLFGRRTSYRASQYWCIAMLWLVKKLCGLSYSVEGQENLPAEPSVVLIKHSSAYETFVQLLFIPKQTWVLKRELMWAPFLGWALATLSPIAINRKAGKSAVDQIIEQGTAKLKQGLYINIFPEGTRMAPGETRRYGLSGALLARSAGCALVPVAHNAADYWPRRGLLKRPGVVRFVIGPPLNPKNRDPREVNRELQNWIESTVADLRRAAGDQPPS